MNISNVKGEFSYAIYNQPKKENCSIKKTINFKNYNPSAANSLERELARKGMICDFANNSFLGECVKRISKVFENLFGRSALPKQVDFKNLFGAYGAYNIYDRTITFNSASQCFDNMKKLKAEALSAKHLITPNEFSTLHPAGTFVHEFSHSAHHNNLNKNHYDGASIMQELRYTQVPSAIGRLITKFKLGKYALDESGGMNEFMAERITQDICKALSSESWIPSGNVDVNYANIFSRKWNYRYSSPQSYLDYYTQQVWNGNIKEAENIAGEIERYLEEIESPRVPASVNTVVNTVTNTTKGTILERVGNGLGNFLTNAAENMTDFLDSMNGLKIKR